VNRPVFEVKGYRALLAGPDDIPGLQRFVDANPEYHQIVCGEAPGPEHGRELLEFLPPPDYAYRAKVFLRYVDEAGENVGVADMIENLFAEGIWHIGLFQVATRLHGQGIARSLYDALEEWARRGGADWLRLGVVVGNVRAERFWEKVGYTDVSKREGVEMGKRVNTLRVMAKPLTGRGWTDYYNLVERDRA
jgi:GNAT superfamily N-acetyltransferase